MSKPPFTEAFGQKMVELVALGRKLSELAKVREPLNCPWTSGNSKLSAAHHH